MKTRYHTSVLLQQTIDALQIRSGDQYIDATLGGGGHTEEILNRGGVVLGIDQDQDAIEYVKTKLQSTDHKVQDHIKIVRGNFEHIGEIAKENGFENVSGVLYDLGISSHHVDEGTRGFSFLHEAPLDMRMNKDLAVTASDLINGLNKGELVQLFENYGEEYFARRIAEAIIQEREKGKIETTTKLAQIIARVYPKGLKKVHPGTKVFQALRIAVNDEIEVLEKSLPQALELLKAGGRIAVISFHSLEDRIVKKQFERWEEEARGKVITKKPLSPTEEEIRENRRARSAKLRVFEKMRF